MPNFFDCIQVPILTIETTTTERAKTTTKEEMERTTKEGIDRTTQQDSAKNKSPSLRYNF